MSVGRPRPLRRIWRKPLTLTGTVVLTGLAIAAGFTTSSAQVRLQGLVNANFHGAYDILVRPPGARLNLEQTRGLVEPNFLGLTGRGGISLAQLSAIRSLPGVGLAAPVSVVGFLRTDAAGVALFTSRLPKQPTLYELSLRASISDGVTSIPLQAQTGRILLAPGVDPRRPETLTRLVTDLEDISNTSDGTYVSFPALPAIESPLIGVDPAAEQQLLGPTAAFLRPLSSIPRGAGRTAASFDRRQVPAEFGLAALQLGGLASGNATTRTRPVIPILVSDRLYSDLRLTIDITQLGRPLTRVPDPNVAGGIDVAAAMAGPGRTSVGRVSLDAGPRLRPFAPPSLVLLWPGSGQPDGVATYPFPAKIFVARVPARPTYAGILPRPGSTAPSFRIVPRGPVTSDGQPAPVGGAPPKPHPGNQLPLAAGRQQSYRTAATYPVAAAHGFSPSAPDDRPFFLAPVGTFDLGNLKLPSNPVDYVPLGAYDPPASQLVADPRGTALRRPRAIKPSLNPLGLLTGPPLAITDLDGAGTLRGAKPIDAIRVRVANVAGFDRQTQRRLEQVASHIADMGLEADIVAGSSPGDVEVYVPQYHVDQQNRDLGWVAQKWTTLGAAQRVTRGFGRANLLLLALGVGIAILFAAAQQAVEGSVRSQEISVLSALGWSRLRILGWLQGEALIGAGVMLLAATLTGLLTGHLRVSALLGLLLAGVYALTSVATAPLSWRRVSPGAIQAGDVRPASWLPRLGAVSGPVSYGRRTALARPVRSAGVISSLGLGAASLVLVGLAGLHSVTGAGTTLLAGAVGSTLQSYQLALLGLSAGGGLLLAAVIMRLTASGQAQERVVLSASGWSSGALHRMDLSHRAHLGAGAALTAAGITAIGTRMVLGGHGLIPVIVAALVAGALALPTFGSYGGAGNGART